MGRTQNNSAKSAAAIAAKKKPVSAKSLLEGLAYKDLKKQCSHHGLETTGNAKQLHARLLEHLVESSSSSSSDSSSDSSDTEMTTSNSNNNKTGDAIAKEMLCPITYELPFDPVMAEDGRVYEHAAIQKHIDNNPTNLKSPITNQPMGNRLVSAIQVKNVIDQAIDNGDITGDLATAWKGKRQQKEQLERWKNEANSGRSKSAIEVAYCYEFGESGCVKKPEEAVKWWKIAADHGEIDGLAMYGMYLTSTVGATLAEKSHALNMIAEAGSRGSKYACLLLGQSYADGDDGIDQNDTHAVRWLRKGLSAFGSSSELKIKPSESHKTKSKTLLARVETRMSGAQPAAAAAAPVPSPRVARPPGFAAGFSVFGADQEERPAAAAAAGFVFESDQEERPAAAAAARSPRASGESGQEDTADDADAASGLRNHLAILRARRDARRERMSGSGGSGSPSGRRAAQQRGTAAESNNASSARRSPDTLPFSFGIRRGSLSQSAASAGVDSSNPFLAAPVVRRRRQRGFSDTLQARFPVRAATRGQSSPGDEANAPTGE